MPGVRTRTRIRTRTKTKIDANTRATKTAIITTFSASQVSGITLAETTNERTGKRRRIKTWIRRRKKGRNRDTLIFEYRIRTCQNVYGVMVINSNRSMLLCEDI